MFRNGLDKFLDKIISRKLLVWITATVMMYGSKITSDDWVLICMIYLGSQGALDIVEKFLSVKNTTTTINKNV
jgi:hypothetical protein